MWRTAMIALALGVVMFVVDTAEARRCRGGRCGGRSACCAPSCCPTNCCPSGCQQGCCEGGVCTVDGDVSSVEAKSDKPQVVETAPVQTYRYARFGLFRRR